MNRSLRAFIEGAGTAIDLAPPAIALHGPDAVVRYWTATGVYVTDAVHAHKAVRDLQEPLFDADADAITRGRDS